MTKDMLELYHYFIITMKMALQSKPVHDFDYEYHALDIVRSWDTDEETCWSQKYLR